MILLIGYFKICYALSNLCKITRTRWGTCSVLTLQRRRSTVDLLKRETPDFIPPSLWPPNSPDLNPVDYQIWDVFQQRVYSRKIQTVDELRQRRGLSLRNGNAWTSAWLTTQTVRKPITFISWSQWTIIHACVEIFSCNLNLWLSK